MGGLAQAMGSDNWDPPFDLAVVQLKRALRGATFALGALLPLRAEGTIEQPVFEELCETLHALQADVAAELSRVRERQDDK